MVKIEISNRTMYFLVTFGIIALFAVGVFAYNSGGPPSVVGHSPEELDLSGVCKSNGADCSPSTQNPLGLYVNSGNELCYSTSSPASCIGVQTSICVNTFTAIVSIEQNCADASLSSDCSSACGNAVACDGDSTQFSCGATTRVFYDQSSVQSCTDDPSGPGTLECDCSVSSGNQEYQNEIPDNSRCV